MTNVSHQSLHVHVHWVPRTSAFSFIFRNLWFPRKALPTCLSTWGWEEWEKKVSSSVFNFIKCYIYLRLQESQCSWRAILREKSQCNFHLTKIPTVDHQRTPCPHPPGAWPELRPIVAHFLSTFHSSVFSAAPCIFIPLSRGPYLCMYITRSEATLVGGTPLTIWMQLPFKSAHRYWVPPLWQAQCWAHETYGHFSDLLKQIQ